MVHWGGEGSSAVAIIGDFGSARRTVKIEGTAAAPTERPTDVLRRRDLYRSRLLEMSAVFGLDSIDDDDDDVMWHERRNYSLSISGCN
jgi:hypothetical protein